MEEDESRQDKLHTVAEHRENIHLCRLHIKVLLKRIFQRLGLRLVVELRVNRLYKITCFLMYLRIKCLYMAS